jgi:DNA adenine methylase
MNKKISYFYLFYKMSFLRWLGGKATQVKEIIPLIQQSKKDLYLEPFVGGGSVFIRLIKEGYKGKVIVNDLNRDLINLYLDVRDNINQLIEELEKFKQKEFSREDFYTYRTEYNTSTTSIRKSALFIILNKTTYRGLFRVNKNGELNMPCGTIPKNLFDKKKLIDVSITIQRVIFENLDYRDFINKYIEEDNSIVCYLDPPYIKQFKSYTNNSFSYKEYDDFIKELCKKDISIICSNNDMWECSCIKNKITITSRDRINVKKPGKMKTEYIYYT